MPDYNAVKVSIKMLSCVRHQDEHGNEYILVSFDDEPRVMSRILDNGDVFFDEFAYKDILKRLLILDWLQEGITGKTATLDCASPNDVWVKGEVL